MGSSTQKTKSKSTVPEWVDKAAEDTFSQAKAAETPYSAYDPGSSVDRYMNPYTDSVVKDTTDEMLRASTIQGKEINTRAAGAGAFGGSRHGIAESELSRNTIDKIGQQANRAYADAYDKANQTGYNEHLRDQGYAQDQTKTTASILGALPYSKTTTQTAPGENVWSQLLGGGVALGGAALSNPAIMSDENTKENRSPADGEKILAKMRDVPVDNYDYKPEAQTAFGVPESRTGPMAQDMGRAFEGDAQAKTIDLPDMLGKLMAAIKSLDARTAGMKNG